MNVFLQRFLDHKKYVLLVLFIMIFTGFLYGILRYESCNEEIKDYLQHLFYLNYSNYKNQYQLYLIKNGIFILICTYLSTSYLGHIGIVFLSFLKGIEIAFSFQFVFQTIDMTLLIFIFLVLELIIEILFVIVISYMCIYLSIYVTLISFFLEQNFHLKSTINYRLNSLIVALLLFSLSLGFRLYFIPLFS